MSHNCLRMITWLKINLEQWPDHVDRPNKFLRCHVSTFLTGQNKEKKLTLELTLIFAEPFKSSLKVAYYGQNGSKRSKRWPDLPAFSQNCRAKLGCSSLTYATQASFLDSMREQTTPSLLTLEVNEIPNLNVTQISC